MHVNTVTELVKLPEKRYEAFLFISGGEKIHEENM
jgi:hypothetical protein